MFAAQRHASLQNDDPVLTQLAGVLSGIDLDLSAFRDLPTTGLSLELDDIYEPGEPVSGRAKPERPEQGDTPLIAVVEDASHPPDARQPEVARAPLAATGDGWHKIELPPLPTGAYRLTVLGTGTVEPVSDVFAVGAADRA